MPRWIVPLSVAVLTAVAPAVLRADDLTDLAPPGLHCPLETDRHASAETFKTGQPIVGATYFYWYDVYTGEHLFRSDGSDALTTHPPTATMSDLSYKSPHWHYAQLRDMSVARLDFFMPVFWGTPGDYEGWSFTGLGPLVQAHDRMIAEHGNDPENPLPPKIAMFYDTSTLQYNVLPDGRRNVRIDLTTREGRDWFYLTIRDFFSMIPPDKWARIDGKPMVFLYAVLFAADVDDRLFDATREAFRKDFGTDLFLVRHIGWPGRSDAWYRWGGALGLTVGDHVAGLGPGYDHSAVPGREPLVVPRRNVRFYREQWEGLLRMNPVRRPWIVHVETWNEWHEGTDIARSRDWGVRYLTATARYGDRFRSRERLEPDGVYVNVDRVRWAGRILGGLTLRDSGGDGVWRWREVDGRVAVTSSDSRRFGAGRHLYFDVDDSYLYDETNRSAEVTVVFHDDSGCDHFRVDYDSRDPSAGSHDGSFRIARTIPLGDTKTWRVVRLQLPDVRFCNRANDADLRLAAVGGDGELTVAEVIVRKLAGTGTTQPAEPEPEP